MADHVIEVVPAVVPASPTLGIRVHCSCTELPLAYRPGPLVLVDLMEIAHLHIETSDRDGEYGAKSAATTEGALSPEP